MGMSNQVYRGSPQDTLLQLLDEAGPSGLDVASLAQRWDHTLAVLIQTGDAVQRGARVWRYDHVKDAPPSSTPHQFELSPTHEHR